MVEKTEIEILYKDNKIRVIGVDYRLRIYKDILTYLDEEYWKPGKPLQYYVVLFKGKKCILIEPLL